MVHQYSFSAWICSFDFYNINSAFHFASAIKALGGKFLREELDPVTDMISEYYEIDVDSALERYRDTYAPYVAEEVA